MPGNSDRSCQKTYRRYGTVKQFPHILRVCNRKRSCCYIGKSRNCKAGIRKNLQKSSRCTRCSIICETKCGDIDCEISERNPCTGREACSEENSLYGFHAGKADDRGSLETACERKQQGHGKEPDRYGRCIQRGKSSSYCTEKCSR